jgi:K+-transporting ATPase ATPase C chain
MENAMNSSISSQWRPAVAAMLLLTAITGVAYPLAVTLVAQVFFPWQANGSLVLSDGSHATGAQPGEKIAGSKWIGQPFDDPRYFWSRVSATTPAPYNAASSSGSNLGPTNPALFDAMKARIAALRGPKASDARPIPVDLATSSASGLDPHISPAAAEWQIPRVASARKIDPSLLRNLVRVHVERRQLGLLGEPRVNVLLLNLALDRATSANDKTSR